MKREYNDEIDAIIYTNKITEVVQKTIQDARKEYIDLEIDYSQTSFILDYLCDKFDGQLDFEIGGFEEIYY